MTNGQQGQGYGGYGGGGQQGYGGGGQQGYGGQSQSRELALMDVRARAEEIAARVRSDPDFVRQLLSNPRATLEQAGLPPDSVNDVIFGESQRSRGGGGFRCMFSIGCVTTRCCLSISVCCFTGSC